MMKLQQMALITIILLAAHAALAETTPPFMGDWQGEFAPGVKIKPRSLVAQVVARGSDSYKIVFLEKFDARCEPYAIVEGKLNGGALVFDQDGWSGRFADGELTGEGVVWDPELDVDNSGAFRLKPVTRLSPRLEAKPKKGAVVLFDGGGLDQWETISRSGQVSPASWEVIDGVLRVKPEFGNHKIGSSLVAKPYFSDFTMHLEFRLPLYPDRRGQRRGNSGVMIEDFEFYEIQILDCYSRPGYYNETGGVYKKAAPKVNMCSPPLQWQSYDITFRSATFDDEGHLKTPPRLTVDHNGVLIHKQLDLPYSDRAVANRNKNPDAKKVGRIKLQDHGYPVEFRNIWIADASGSGK